MKILSKWFCSGLLALACSAHSELALGQLSQCAWPIEFSPEGYGNVVAPDDQARYWLMPFDTHYDTMKIEGSYPNARYFSFAVYNGDASGRPISVAGHKYDAIITPEADSVSAKPNANSSTRPANDSYTLCITRSGAQCTNTINVTDQAPYKNQASVVLRIYAPTAEKAPSGQALMGGRPLPKVTLLGAGGSQAVEACPLSKDAPTQPDPTTHYTYDKSVNKLQDIRTLLDAFFPASFDIYTPSDYYEKSEDRLWFAPPKEPPIPLLPNPDNKYIATQPGPYQPGRIIVIHGKAPSFPGAPAPSRGSRSPDVRYWSLCNNDLALPVSAVRCVDDQAAVIQGGYYTLVVSDDLRRPNWLQPSVNWLPWGDTQYPKLIFFRNLIPVARNDTNYTKDEIPFPYAIQWVVQGCPGNCEHKDAAIDFTLPYVPPRAVFAAAGSNAQRIMGDYYPVAVWCDKTTFDQAGWQGCIRGVGKGK